jgi:hypothetical protein
MLIGAAVRTIKLKFRIANQKACAQHGRAVSSLFAIQELEMKSASIGAGTITPGSLRTALRIAEFILAS